MTVYSIWETMDSLCNEAKLLFNDEINVLTIYVKNYSGDGICILTEKDLGRLAHHIAAFFMDRSLKAEAEKEAKE